MRIALVTGGTSGIGLAIAKALVSRGDAAFICGRDSARLDAALAALAADGRDRIAGTTCDVRDPAAAAAAVALAHTRFGGIDALVNSAGAATVAPFEELAPAAWHEMIDTNLTGVYNCCRAALPLLKRAGAVGRADIVNVGSRAGRYAFRGGVAYNATKFGLQGFTEALFLDVHQFGVRVSLVAPGTVATGFGGTPPQEWQLQPVDVARAVVHVLDQDSRASSNWVEIRPARPPGA